MGRFLYIFSVLTCLSCSMKGTEGATETCFDYIGNGLHCTELSGICSDEYAQVVCRRSCNFCTPSSTAESPTPSDSSIPWTERCDDHLVSGLTCIEIPGVCGDPYGQLFCRRHCGSCNDSSVTTTVTTQPTAKAGQCDLSDHSQCDTLDNVCSDSGLSHVLCPHYCGFCGSTTTIIKTTTPIVETCVDNLGNGLFCHLLPSVCSDPYAQVVCRRTCNFCVPNPNAVTLPPSSTSSSSSGGCVDHVVNGLMCAGLPNVCSDQYGRIFCQKTCGICGQQIEPSTTKETTTPIVETCVDNIGGELYCHQLPNFCSNAYAQVVCRRTCKFCEPNPHAVTLPPSSTSSSSSGGCVDHVVNGLTCAGLPNVCSDPYGQIYCQKHCGLCESPTTTQPPTIQETTPIVDTCVDNIGDGLFCHQLPNFCSNAYAQVVCRRTCGICQPNPHAVTPLPSTSSPSSGGCMDHVVNGLMCAALPNVCSDQYGQIYCQKYCGMCDSPTTTEPDTTTQPPTTQETTTPIVETCVDNIGDGLFCHQLPNFCSNAYAQVVCRRTCALCQPNPHAVTPQPSTSSPSSGGCMDHVVNGLMCAVLPNVCLDQYGQIYCQKYCGKCDSSTTMTTKPQTTTQPLTTLVTTAPVVETCVDNIGDGLSCQQLPNICSDPYAQVVCRRTCNYCEPNPNAVTLPPSSTSSPSSGGCVDHVVNGLTCAALPGVCTDQSGQIFCQKHCGKCGNTETTTAAVSPTVTFPASTSNDFHPATCIDHIGNGMQCSSYSGLCDSRISRLLCPRFCTFCVPATDSATAESPTATTASPTDCVDRVINGLTCLDIPNICDDEYGKRVCAKTCGTCAYLTLPHYSTSEAATTGVSRHTENPTSPIIATQSTLPPATLKSTLPVSATMSATTAGHPGEVCSDNIGLGLTCDALPGACNDPLAEILCKQTCGFCDCQDKIVGMTCQDLVEKYDTNPCTDALGHQVCSKFCGFC